MATIVKIGDKVRYLNSVGGGVVRGFQKKNIALVEEEDGFETPVLITEIVVVKETNQYNFPVEEPVHGIADKKGSKDSENVKERFGDEEAEDIKLPEYSWSERDETKDGERLSVYLAFVPNDLKQLQTTDMELYLVNDSNYYLQFALFGGIENAGVRVRNVIEPQTKLYLETINKTVLNDISELRFQAIAYKRIKFEVKPPLDVPLKINPVKFYKLHSFKDNDFFDESAMLVTIIRNDVLDLGMQIDPVQLQQAMISKRSADIPNMDKSRQSKKIKPSVLEVDLHINELVDTVAGLSKGDMLQLQLDTFNRIMQENLKFKNTKIVFIHGKGEGVLRAEIEKQLKRKYPKCEFQDASFQQYGFGATQVTIH